MKLFNVGICSGLADSNWLITRSLAATCELETVSAQVERLSVAFTVRFNGYAHVSFMEAQSAGHQMGRVVRLNGTIVLERDKTIKFRWSRTKILEGNQVETFKWQCNEHECTIQDGDTCIMRGHCQCDGFRIGFGDCVGQILPADL